MPARLPRLELQEVEDLLLAVEHQVVEAQQDALALGEARGLPLNLHGTGRADGIARVLRRAARNIAQGRAGEGLFDLHSLAVAEGVDARGEGGELLGADTTGRKGR